MSDITAPLDRYSDQELMDRYFQLSSHPEEHGEELAAIDAAIQSRLLAAYGAAPPGAYPRVRYAAPI